MAFLQQEGVGVVVSESALGDGGTVFVTRAIAPSTNALATGDAPLGLMPSTPPPCRLK